MSLVRLGCANLLTAGGVVLAVLPLVAQDADDSLSDVNVPYTHYFGTGTYLVDGVRTWVLSAMVRPSLASVSETRKVGFALRLGASVAAQGLEGDLEPGLIPFVTLVPGLEVRLRLSDRALLMPFVDVGVAWTTRTKDATALTSVGIRGEFLFPAGRFELALQPHVLVSEAWARDDFFGDGLFLTSLTADVRHPLWFTLAGSQADIGVYGAATFPERAWMLGRST